MQCITCRRPRIYEVPVRLVDLLPSTTHVATDGSMQIIPPVDHASLLSIPSPLSHETSAHPATSSSSSQPVVPTESLLSGSSPVLGPDPTEVHDDTGSTASPSTHTRVRSLRDIYARLNLATTVAILLNLFFLVLY